MMSPRTSESLICAAHWSRLRRQTPFPSWSGCSAVDDNFVCTICSSRTTGSKPKLKSRPSWTTDREGTMGANVAFTDFGGFTGTHFPKLIEFEDQQQYQAPQTRSDRSFKDIGGKCSSLERVLEKAAIVAPTDSAILLHEEPRSACDIPLANLSRALQLLAIAPTAERQYAADEIELLSQVA